MKALISVSTCIGLLMAMLLGSPTPAEGQNSASKKAKILNFPRERSLGTLAIRDIHQKWTKIAARGSITIPPRSYVELILNYDSANALSALEKLPPDGLNMLVLSRLEVGDSQMPIIAHFTGLDALDLTETDVTDKGLPSLLPLTRLTYIDLHGTDITAEGCKTLAGMSSLQHVDIGSNHIGDDGMHYLLALKKMHDLSVFRIGLTNRGLIPISKMTQLTHLDIQFNERITDAGIAKLTTLKNLKTLQLGETSIGSSSITPIVKLVSLENLVYSRMQFDRLELKEIQNALPKCLLQTTNEHKGIPADLLDLRQ